MAKDLVAVRVSVWRRMVESAVARRTRVLMQETAG